VPDSVGKAGTRRRTQVTTSWACREPIAVGPACLALSKAARLAALFAPAPAYGDQNPSNPVSPNAVNVNAVTEHGLHGPVMPPNPSNDLKRQRRQRRRHDHEHALGAPVMPPTPSDDLAKLASCRPNDGRLALRPLRTVATSPSIGAGRSALRHPGRDRLLGYAHAGTVA
jgi:hypothetical protein